MTVNPTTDTRAPGPEAGRKSGTGAIIALVLGIAFALMGVGGIIAGAATAAAFPEQGQDGYLTSSVGEVSTTSYALTSPPAAIGVDNLPFDLGSLRFTAESTAPDGQVFIGIGQKADVDRYLSGIHTTEITSVQILPSRVQYRDVPGSAAPTPPSEQAFWAASSSGSGTQQVTMDLRSGDWVVVIMSSNASAGVTAHMRAAVNSTLFETVISGLWIGGIVVLIFGAGLIAVGATLLRRQLPTPGTGTPGSPGTGMQHPVRLSERTDGQSPEVGVLPHPPTSQEHLT